MCALPTARAQGICPSALGRRAGLLAARHAARRRPLQRRDLALRRRAKGQPTELHWDGAHTGITFSPDGNFLVTTMQENALHGWKLADSKHMRMTGYPAKVKSLSWSAKGKWLASSGAPAAIVWPFQGKDGPMGKAPLELGTRGNAMVTAVACHPSQDIAAIGYADGMVMAVRFADAEGSAAAPPRQGCHHLDDVGHRRTPHRLRQRSRRLRRHRHRRLRRRLLDEAGNRARRSSASCPRLLPSSRVVDLQSRRCRRRRPRPPRRAPSS